MRDKYDELSASFKQAAEVEECNETLHTGLCSYSKAYSLLADINDLEVQRLHGKVMKIGKWQSNGKWNQIEMDFILMRFLQVVRELANYEVICKNTRELMKHSILMRDKELIRRHHIDQIKQRSQQRNAGVRKCQ